MSDHGFDHGLINLPLNKRGGRTIDQEIDAWKRGEATRLKAEATAARVRRDAARETEAARVKLTAAEVVGARAVRDRFGWHRVVRVNAKTVTIKTAYSWTERIGFDRVLEVR